jgi:hypothetical protein
MTDSSTTLEEYAYVGLNTVVERTHPEPDMMLTYIGTGTGEAGDKYVGLDRFGRRQCLARLLVREFSRREPVQFVVHQRQQLLGRMRVAAVDGMQDLCDVAHPLRG